MAPRPRTHHPASAFRRPVACRRVAPYPVGRCRAAPLDRRPRGTPPRSAATAFLGVDPRLAIGSGRTLVGGRTEADLGTADLTMEFHPEVMTEPQRQALLQLAAAAPLRNMYLGGGTAVAIQFGHRTSVDLDWFTEQPLQAPAELAGEIAQAAVPFQTSSVARGTLHGSVAGVRTSFYDCYGMAGGINSRHGARPASVES